MYSFKILVGMALAAAIGLVSFSTAQQPTPTPTPVQAKDTGVLTEESLKEMLTNLGFEPNGLKGTDGRTLFYIKVTRANTTYTPYVCISPSKTKIWAQTSLGDLTAEDPAARSLKFLELNLSTGPSHFVYIPKDKTVYMFSPMDNRGVTPKILKDHIDGMVDNCEKTKEHWQAAAPAPKAEQVSK